MMDQLTVGATKKSKSRIPWRWKFEFIRKSQVFGLTLVASRYHVNSHNNLSSNNFLSNDFLSNTLLSKNYFV
jgi:hypothetical protein